MNEETDEINALVGGDDAKPSNQGSEDLESLRSELAKAKEYQSTQNGRLKQQNEELVRLRAELEGIRARKQEEELIGSLSQDERDSVPDEALSAAAKMVGKGIDKVSERLDELERRRSREEAGSFFSAIDREFPGWRSSVGPGGDKRAAWNQYLTYNAPSVRAAMERFDIETIRYHVRAFYNSVLGIPAPSGFGAPAVSDPSSQRGGTTPNQYGGEGDAELSNLFDLKEAARDRGDYAEVNRLGNEINNIMRRRNLA